MKKEIIVLVIALFNVGFILAQEWQTDVAKAKEIALNENNVRGSIKTASVTVVKKRFKKNKDGTIQDLLSGKKRNRFIDNGNGTITDIYTSLMWLQQPKQIATTYGEAIDFCNSFNNRAAPELSTPSRIAKPPPSTSTTSVCRYHFPFLFKPTYNCIVFFLYIFYLMVIGWREFPPTYYLFPSIPRIRSPN